MSISIHSLVLLCVLRLSTSSTLMQYVNYLPGTETCPGFAIEAPPRVAPIRSSLYTAATAGNLEQVEQLLQQANVNVYESDDTDESLLSRVMRRKHESVANRLLDEYQKDLNIIGAFFRKNNINLGNRICQRHLVALGIDEATAVRSHVTDGMQLPRNGLQDQPAGLIILLKQLGDNVESEVLWLSPSKPGDDRALARIVDLIYRNGMIDVEKLEHVERSLFDVAAQSGLIDIFFRLDRMFGDSLGWSAVKYMSLLCQLASSENNLVSTINSYIVRLNRFDLATVCKDEDAWRILEIPIKQGQIDVFDYFLDKIEINSKRSATQTLNDLVRYSKYFSMDAQSGTYHADLALITPYFWKHKVNLLAINEAIPQYKNWTPLILVLVQSSPTELAEYLNDHESSISNDLNLAINIFSTLLRSKQLQVLRAWRYLTIDDLPHRLKYQMNSGIWQENDMETIGFLLDLCYEKLTEKSITQNVCMLSHVPNSSGVLQRLLAHPESLSVTEMRMNEQVWTPLARALVTHNLDNYRVMYESVEGSKEDITIVMDNGGLNLLAAAIWNRQPVWSEYDGEYGDLPQMDDDEFLPLEKCPKITEPSQEDEENQRQQYNEIFTELVNLGADPNIVSTYGENLIHIAVKCDNIWAVQELIRHDVDPNRSASGGIRPIHLVRSVQMLNLLMSILPDDVLTVTDDRGYTPLSAYCTSFRVPSKDVKLLDAMLEFGGNVSETNSHDQSTPLHHVGDDLQLTKWLLKHGADVNAQDNKGFTPLYEASIRFLRFEVMKELFSVPSLDINLVTKSNVTYLAALVRLSETQFEEIQPVIERRQSEFDELFRKHCNSMDDHQSPIIYTAIRSDTNDYCLQKLLACENLNKDGLAMSAIGEPMRLRRVIENEGASVSSCQASSSLTYAIGNKFVGMMSYPESLRILLANGVSAMADDTHGQKPLHSIFHFGCGPKAVVECASALIAAGADYRSEVVVERVRQSVLGCLLEMEPIQTN